MKDTKLKATPGPWRVDVGGFSSSRDFAQTFSVEGPPSDFMYLERIEDAYLISAAPDLYEALEAVIAVADRNTVEFDRAKAALAKARGEA